MKLLTRRLLFSALLIGAFWLAATDAWARLPKPIEASGTVLAVDHETKTLVFKVGEDKKPLVLDWNKDTEFIKNGLAASPAALTNGTRVVIFYKNVSFRNPLLKKVVWEDGTPKP